MSAEAFAPSERLLRILALLEEQKLEHLRSALALAEELGGFAERVKQIKIHGTPITEGIELPNMAHPTEDVGFDIRTAVDFTVEPHRDVKVPTGLIFDLPVHGGLVRVALVIEQRTGNGGKGLIPGATIVDPGYRPDPEDPNGLTLWLRNVSDEKLEFKKGDRIVQGLFVPMLAPALVSVGKEEVNWETKRGGTRFGGTGN